MDGRVTTRGPVDVVVVVVLEDVEASATDEDEGSETSEVSMEEGVVVESNADVVDTGVAAADGDDDDNDDDADDDDDIDVGAAPAAEG